MSNDLVTRLRDFPVRDCCSQRAEAADRIEQLEARLDRLIKTIDDAQQDLRLLDALRYAGVDNWAGYEYALEVLEGKEERQTIGGLDDE